MREHTREHLAWISLLVLTKCLGNRDIRDAAMSVEKHNTPAPIGLLPTAIVFGFFSLLLWLTVVAVIPWLRDAFDVPPIIGWYISGTVLVLLPILIFGSMMAWRELPVQKLSEWRRRLRLVRMNRGD